MFRFFVRLFALIGLVVVLVAAGGASWGGACTAGAGLAGCSWIAGFSVSPTWPGVIGAWAMAVRQVARQPEARTADVRP